VAGAVLTLIPQDSTAGVTRRAAISGEDGRYAIAAPGAGSYVLETKRIGVRRVISHPFALAADEARRMDVAVAFIATQLGAIAVTERASCGARVSSDPATAALWDEASAALTAARLTRETQTLPLEVTYTTRILDLNAANVVDERRSAPSPLVGPPFASPPAEQLSRVGFVERLPGDSLKFDAPDAGTLTSSSFVRDHCFGVRRGDADHRGEIALTFVPAPDRNRPDIQGALWIDATSRELRSIDYEYVNVGFPTNGARLGGTVQLARLQSGKWIVSRWAIRMPRFVVEQTGLRARALRIGSILETGGIVTVRQNESAHPFVVAGVATDSTTGAPLANARVDIDGTNHSATTDAAGRFRIELADSGKFTLSLHHARVDSLGIEPPVRGIVTTRGESPVTVAIPSAAVVRRSLCGDANGETAVLRLWLHGANGVPLAETRIDYVLRFFTKANGIAAPSGDVVDSGPAVTTTDGVLLLCGVPTGRRVRVELHDPSRNVAYVNVLVAPNEIVLRSVTLQ
jgi:hypothetical protein